eukprot:7387432-Prymnesium_polylepis.1
MTARARSRDGGRRRVTPPSPTSSVPSAGWRCAGIPTAARGCRRQRGCRRSSSSSRSRWRTRCPILPAQASACRPAPPPPSSALWLACSLTAGRRRPLFRVFTGAHRRRQEAAVRPPGCRTLGRPPHVSRQMAGARLHRLRPARAYDAGRADVASLVAGFWEQLTRRMGGGSGSGSGGGGGGGGGGGAKAVGKGR